jgi:hypothetical protein
MWVKLTPNKMINTDTIAVFEKTVHWTLDGYAYCIDYTYARERDTFIQEYGSEDTRNAYFDSIYRQLNTP